MLEIGDLVRIKKGCLRSFDNQDDFGLVVKIEKHFYKTGPLGTGSKASIDRVYIDWIFNDMNFAYSTDVLEKA